MKNYTILYPPPPPKITFYQPRFTRFFIIVVIQIYMPAFLNELIRKVLQDASSCFRLP